jgi:hypothetical protein
VKALPDLPDGGRYAVALPEDPDELEHLALPTRHLFHPVKPPLLAGPGSGPDLNRMIVNTR